MMKFMCDDCGPLDHVLMDGYPFGDRVLEGVMFEVRYIDGKFDVKISEADKEYFDKLHKNYYLRAAREHAEDNDVAECPLCRGDVSAQPHELQENGKDLT